MKFNDNQKREKWLAFVQTLNPDVDPQSTRLLDEMRLVGRALHHIGEHSLDAAGLSFAQYRLLMDLLYCEQVEGRNDGLNPSEISERQGTSRNTISSLIRNLEDEALITRQLDPNDRRKFNIFLTTAGKELVMDHARSHFRVIASCFSILSPDEQTSLSALLLKIGQHASQVLEQDE